MKWSQNLRTLRRGIKIATRVAKARLDALSGVPATRPMARSRFVTFDGFGDNPGHLRMFAHLPNAVTGRPLVVLLHGCGQDAARFAGESGWIALADRLRFTLILPEQAEANNAARCFQWYHACDTKRDTGEAASIAAMTRAAVARFQCDPKRVFVVGLSAGGAMAAAMLAAYPDLFAAGASVAGLPVGSARSSMQAVVRMAAAGPDRSAEEWAAIIRAGVPAGYAGPWPRLSVWHGRADTTVAPGNSDLLVRQWCGLHGLTAAPVSHTGANGVEHRMWPSAAKPLVEQWWLPQLAHAYPVGARVAKGVAKGVAGGGQFVAPAAVDATARIGKFLGLD